MGKKFGHWLTKRIRPMTDKPINKIITTIKYSSEEIELLNKLVNLIDEVDKVSKKLKSMNSNHIEVGLTADMWSKMSKDYLETMMFSFEEDRGTRQKLN